jgi:hypothetical protein
MVCEGGKEAENDKSYAVTIIAHTRHAKRERQPTGPDWTVAPSLSCSFFVLRRGLRSLSSSLAPRPEGSNPKALKTSTRGCWVTIFLRTASWTLVWYRPHHRPPDRRVWQHRQHGSAIVCANTFFDFCQARRLGQWPRRNALGHRLVRT